MFQKEKVYQHLGRGTVESKLLRSLLEEITGITYHYDGKGYKFNLKLMRVTEHAALLSVSYRDATKDKELPTKVEVLIMSTFSGYNIDYDKTVDAFVYEWLDSLLNDRVWVELGTERVLTSQQYDLCRIGAGRHVYYLANIKYDRYVNGAWEVSNIDLEKETFKDLDKTNLKYLIQKMGMRLLVSTEDTNNSRLNDVLEQIVEARRNKSKELLYQAGVCLPTNAQVEEVIYLARRDHEPAMNLCLPFIQQYPKSENIDYSKMLNHCFASIRALHFPVSAVYRVTAPHPLLNTLQWDSEHYWLQRNSRGYNSPLPMDKELIELARMDLKHEHPHINFVFR